LRAGGQIPAKQIRRQQAKKQSRHGPGFVTETKTQHNAGVKKRAPHSHEPVMRVLGPKMQMNYMVGPSGKVVNETGDFREILFGECLDH
jgi:hypothetical protein